jgi:large subunit ribosomal protein L4
MVAISVLNSEFEKSNDLETKIALSPESINVPVVHQVVKAILAGRRQGNASTKNRTAVRGGGAKPFKQKGTGRARQGSTSSPLQKGGGVVFGPQVRSYDEKLNKKVKESAILAVLADKFQSGKLTVIESLESNGKTKELFAKLDGKGLLPALVVTDNKNSLALRAVRNLRNAKGMSVEGFSVYEAVKYENLIIEKNAIQKLFKRLG